MLIYAVLAAGHRLRILLIREWRPSTERSATLTSSFYHVSGLTELHQKNNL